MDEGLELCAIADRSHQAGDPGAGIGLSKRYATFVQEIQHELEMLEFFNGDGVELLDAGIEGAIFLEVQRGRRGLAFEMGVIDQKLGKMAQYFGQPTRQNF